MGPLKERYVLLLTGALLLLFIFIAIGLYLNHNAPRTQTPPASRPGITERDAIRIASGEFPGMTVTNTTTGLYVTDQSGKGQRLIWSVDVHGRGEYAAVVNATDKAPATVRSGGWGGTVTIDAATGSVIDVSVEV